MSRTIRYAYVHVFPVCIHPHSPTTMVECILRNGAYMAWMQLWHLYMREKCIVRMIRKALIWWSYVSIYVMSDVHADLACMHGKYHKWWGGLELLVICYYSILYLRFAWIPYLGIFVTYGFFQHTCPPLIHNWNILTYILRLLWRTRIDRSANTQLFPSRLQWTTLLSNFNSFFPLLIFSRHVSVSVHTCAHRIIYLLTMSLQIVTKATVSVGG